MLLRIIIICLFSVLVGCKSSAPPAKTYTHSGLGLLGAALSSNGEHALVSTVDLGVQYWDLKSNKLLFKIKHQDEQDIIALDIAPEAPIAVSLSTDSLAVWDLGTGQSYRFLKLNEMPTAVTVSKTGKYALVGFVNYHAKLIDLTQAKVLRHFEHADIVNAVNLSAKQDLAIIGSDDTAVRVWELNTGHMRHQWFHPAKVTHLNSSPNNQYLLNHSAQHKAWIHDLNSGSVVSELSPPKTLFSRVQPAILSSVFSKDSQTLYTGHPPNLIRVWDVASGTLQKEIKMPKRSLWQPSASLALDMTLNQDGSILTIETSNGQAYQYYTSELR